MAALVQSFPQQSSTVTMLQTRPASASGPFQTSGQAQQHIRTPQMPRNIYNINTGTTSYRGHTPMSPVAPYAFTTTPALSGNANPLRQNPTTPHLRLDNRTSSAPVLPYSHQVSANNLSHQTQRQHSIYPVNSTGSETVASSSTPDLLSFAKDDSLITPKGSLKIQRPLSSIELNTPDLSPSGSVIPTKPSPDRYRRNHRRAETSVPATTGQTLGGSALPSGSGMATVSHLYVPAMSSPATFTASQKSNVGSPLPTRQDGPLHHSPQLQPISKDDTSIQFSSPEQAKRYRRRSIGNMEPGDSTGQHIDTREQKTIMNQPRTYASVVSSPSVSDVKDRRPSPPHSRPSSSHGRNGSDESVGSNRTGSRPSSSKRDAGGIATANPTVLQGTPIVRHEAKLVNIPPRASSDANKRFTSPSPLSKPPSMTPEPPSVKNVQPKPSPDTFRPPETTSQPAIVVPESSAAQHLAALNKKEGKKDGKPSRLRRAFSFGSSAELRKASAENSHNNSLSAERAKLRKDRYQDEQEAEQAAIVQKQEAGGLGEGIYSGQGHFFTGSTDNLSISSTASSASIMIRKMGKGMKKSTRSLVGLFRPKSVIGVPAADGPVPEASIAQVSMVTVEAEREKVNVNANPHDQAGGGTGYPKLERNSIDAANAAMNVPSRMSGERNNDHTQPRRSIVGGEKERSEVLAAVKKGILKRNLTGTDSGNSSPVNKPVDIRSTDYSLPQIPTFNDSPISSAPSTPGDDHPSRSSHRRTDSVTIEGDDYFMSIARFANSDSKSIPGTPRSIMARNISFSPRIQFHDTWPSGEYDRRGEIATCNRLTPMLAQQIKEELNTFKMEMEVHEQSKVYTHFF